MSSAAMKLLHVFEEDEREELKWWTERRWMKGCANLHLHVDNTNTLCFTHAVQNLWQIDTNILTYHTHGCYTSLTTRIDWIETDIFDFKVSLYTTLLVEPLLQKCILCRRALFISYSCLDPKSLKYAVLNALINRNVEYSHLLLVQPKKTQESGFHSM